MKPYIVGLNNPLSSRPRDALVPWPGQCSGARLVQMAQLVDPKFDETEYLDSFELRNLWGGKVLPKGTGTEALYRREAAKLRREIEAHEARAVIVLGAIVAGHVGSTRQWPFFTSLSLGGRYYWKLPHPSGQCRLYNTPDARRKAGEIIVSVARARLAVVRSTSHG